MSKVLGATRRALAAAALLLACCAPSKIPGEADQPHTGAVPQPAVPQPAATDDSVSGKLVKSILALGDGPLGTLHDVTSRLDLPQPLRSGRSTRFEIPDTNGPLCLVLSLQAGSWERPRGNSDPRMFMVDPIVVGVELTGPDGLVSPAPESASTLQIQARTKGGSPTSVAHWGHNFYFEQGRDGQPWYLGRFVGRAPFHYSELERTSLENALIEVTGRLASGEANLQAMMSRLYENKRRSDGVYDFGAGCIAVGQPDHMVIDFVGPMKMPNLFAAHGIVYIYTSFAHDVGQMVEPLEAKGFTILPSRYVIRDEASGEAEMGEAAEARLRQLSISAKPDQASKIRDTPTPTR